MSWVVLVLALLGVGLQTIVFVVQAPTVVQRAICDPGRSPRHALIEIVVTLLALLSVLSALAMACFGSWCLIGGAS